ncbi:MAG TPA: hypothetical protein VIP11_18135 [Gemmatimonadaceae bacterium]
MGDRCSRRTSRQDELQKNTFQGAGDSIKAAGQAKAILSLAES